MPDGIRGTGVEGGAHKFCVADVVSAFSFPEVVAASLGGCSSISQVVNAGSDKYTF